ncbi:hypothetical protein F5I97DRAFT_468787 [Phlebopus sp. FC_14]|nr:hypothetical protein F5I97DRAFT_468787 [Phlebopus sp. FC_14]
MHDTVRYRHVCMLSAIDPRDPGRVYGRPLGTGWRVTQRTDESRTTIVSLVQLYYQDGQELSWNAPLDNRKKNHSDGPCSNCMAGLAMSRTTVLISDVHVVAESISTFVPPSGDYTLIEPFNLGLVRPPCALKLQQRSAMYPKTNLAFKLSQCEMVASVPAFLAKIAVHKLRFVCFVGMEICNIVKSVLAKMPPSANAKVKGNKRSGNQASSDCSRTSWYIRLLKMPMADVKASEALFFVAQYVWKDRTIPGSFPPCFFTELRMLLHKLPAGIDTSAMRIVPEM